jgi:hypothetical protein
LGIIVEKSLDMMMILCSATNHIYFWGDAPYKSPIDSVLDAVGSLKQTIQDPSTPRQMELYTLNQITKIYCKYKLLAFITSMSHVLYIPINFFLKLDDKDKGELFIWGKNDGGRLMQSDSTLQPSKLPFFEDKFVVDVSFGKFHVSALLGELFFIIESSNIFSSGR